MGLPEGVARYLERYGADDVADAVYWTAIGRLELAVNEARDSLDGRWRSYPKGELRRLRRNVAAALVLARFAVELRELDRQELADVLLAQTRKDLSR